MDMIVKHCLCTFLSETIVSLFLQFVIILMLVFVTEVVVVVLGYIYRAKVSPACIGSQYLLK